MNLFNCIADNMTELFTTAEKMYFITLPSQYMY